MGKRSLFGLLGLGMICLLLFTQCDTYVTSAKVYMQQSNYDKAIEMSQLALAQNPKNAEAYFVLGQAYGSKGMYRDMNDAFNKCLEISKAHEKDVAFYKEKYYADLFNSGVDDIRRGNLEKAVEKFKLAIEILPRRVDGYKNLAYTYTQLQQDSLAIDTYKQAIQIDPNDMELHIFLGILYYRNKMYEESISAFQPILEKGDPRSKSYSEALYYTAYSYDLLGKSDKALETYKSALEASPDDKDLIFNLGRLYYMQSNYEKAIEYFGKVLSADSTDFDANINIGNSYIQLKKFKESLPYLERATRLQPDNPNAWYNLAVALVNLGDTKRGTEALKKSEELQKSK